MKFEALDLNKKVRLPTYLPLNINALIHKEKL